MAPLSEHQYVPVNRLADYFSGVAKHVLPHSLASRILEARKDAAMTQVQLAERSGIGQSALSSLETGETINPQAGTLLRLAKALGVEATWLDSGQPPKRLAGEWPMRNMWLALELDNQRALLSSARGMLADQARQKPTRGKKGSK